MSAPKFDYVLVDYAVLKCPSCGGDNLHQGTAKVFDRDEDDEVVAVTTIKDGLSATHRRLSEDAGNPSSRRHGLTIEFSCENCDGQTLTLGISQHKGCTRLEWLQPRG